MVFRVCVLPLLAALAEASVFLGKSSRHLPASQLVVVHSKIAKHVGTGEAAGGGGADVPWDAVLDAEEFDVEAELKKASGSKKTTSEFSAKKTAKKANMQIKVNLEDDLKLALRDKDWADAGEIQGKLDKHNGKKRHLLDVGKHGGEKRTCKNAEKAKEELQALEVKQEEANGDEDNEEEDPAEKKKREDADKKEQEECEKKVVILTKNLKKDNFTTCPTELILKGAQAAKTYNTSNIFGVYTLFEENEADRAMHLGRRMFINEKTGLSMFFSKKFGAWRIGSDFNSVSGTKVISPREELTWCPTSATEWKVYNGFGFAETDITVTKNDAKAEAEAAKAEAEKVEAAKAKAEKAEAAKAEAKKVKAEKAMAAKAKAAKAEAKKAKADKAVATKAKAEAAAKDEKKTAATKEEKKTIPGAISMKADKKPAAASVAIAAALAASYGMDAKVRETQSRADKIKDVPGAEVKFMPKVEEAKEEEAPKTQAAEAPMKEEEEAPKAQAVEAPMKAEEEAPKAVAPAAISVKDNQKKAHEWAKNRMSDLLKRSGIPDYRTLYASRKGAKAVVAAAPPVVYASTKVTKAVVAKPKAKAAPVVAKVAPVAAPKVAKAIVAKAPTVVAVATAAAAKPVPVVAQPVVATPEDHMRDVMQDMMKMAMKSVPKAQKPVTQLFQESEGSDGNDAETNAQVDAEFNNAIETI